MTDNKFDPKKLKKLNNPDRLKATPPQRIWELLNLKNSEVLVDIGAGTGFFSVPFVKMTNNGKVYACDISETMVAWMRQNICNTHPDVIPVKMEESSVDLPDGEADLVFMIALHHELHEPAKMLVECGRLLKPGGKILIMDWKKSEMNQGPPISIRCDVSDVKQQLVHAEFKQVEIVDEFTQFFCIFAVK
ncbi:class I SAM-dependent methyltransferase [Desulfobacter sp.]|jgi:ubiquinone/menaquinone biosynthesis C-methylase UbiE